MDRKEKSVNRNRASTPGTKNDILITALAAEANVRIFAVSGAALVAEAQRVHGLSRVGTAALGRMLMMTALLAADLKNPEDRVSAIIKGDGPAGSLVCTGSPDLSVKGTVGNPEAELPPKSNGKLDVGGYVGHSGRLTVVRDLGLKEPYIGASELVSGEIAEDFSRYFMVSQQQPTIVYLGVREHAESGRVRAAGGILVQPLPGCPGDVLDDLEGRAEQISHLAEQLDHGMSLEAALLDLFGDLGLATVSERQPAYRCDCSRERIEKALISVGASELMDMIKKDHGAEVTCHFCNERYTFSEAQLTELLWSAAPERTT